jgi:hypothetical protein
MGHESESAQCPAAGFLANMQLKHRGGSYIQGCHVFLGSSYRGDQMFYNLSVHIWRISCNLQAYDIDWLSGR